MFFLKTRITLKRNFLAIKKVVNKLISNIEEKIVSWAKNTGSAAKKAYLSIIKKASSFLKKVAGKIKPKKKSSEEEKTEDQKLAEKILAKK